MAFVCRAIRWHSF